MYNQELYLLKDNQSVKARIRNYGESDFQALIGIQQECFPPPFPSELWWKEEQLHSHIHHFPAGALCMEIDKQLVGSITGLIVEFDPGDAAHTWEEITDQGYIQNHKPNGNTLYIVDISVRPAYRKLGVGKWLMQSMYGTVVFLGLQRLLGGGRMPGYSKYADVLTAEQYLRRVMRGELNDPVVTFLLRCGRTPVQVIDNYLEDAESCNHAVLMEWKNPFLACRS